MGYFARHFPNLVSDRAPRIIKQILYEIENEVNTLSPLLIFSFAKVISTLFYSQIRTYDAADNIVIGGCIEALSGLFASFALTINSDVKEKVHNYLLCLIMKGFNFKTRYTPRGTVIM